MMLSLFDKSKLVEFSLQKFNPSIYEALPNQATSNEFDLDRMGERTLGLPHLPRGIKHEPLENDSSSEAPATSASYRFTIGT